MEEKETRQEQKQVEPSNVNPLFIQIIGMFTTGRPFDDDEPKYHENIYKTEEE